jgi:hypothetical protein
MPPWRRSPKEDGLLRMASVRSPLPSALATISALSAGRFRMKANCLPSGEKLIGLSKSSNNFLGAPPNAAI